MVRSTDSFFLRDIQGLRAIAVILVILAHAGIPGMQGGFIGVDVFFVLSGYLITGILYREYHSTGTIRLHNFYSRRLKRLLPAMLTMILLTSVAASILLSSQESSTSSRSALFALTWTSNLFFAFRDIDYFNELETSDLFLHTWSLGLEEQFYLLWPLLLLAIFRLSIKPDAADKYRARPTVLVYLLSIAAISMATSIWWTEIKPMWAYYLMPARIWQFALGALVFFFTAAIPGGYSFQKTIGIDTFLRWAGLATLLVAATLIDPARNSYPGFWAILPTLGTALILASINTNRHSSVLGNSLVVWIGDRSYSWYLWHWPIFTIAGLLNIFQDTAASFILILISLIAASISYVVIERPFWHGRFSFFKPRTVFTGSLTAVLLGTLTINLVQTEGDLVNESTIAADIQQAKKDMPIIYGYGCDTWYSSEKAVPCEFRADNYGKTIVLLGDSVLAQWFTLFAEIYSPPEWRILVYTKSACPIVDEDFFYERIGSTYSVCTNWRNSVIEAIGNIEPDVLILGSGNTEKFNRVQWIEGTKRILDKVTIAAQNTYILVGTPALPFNGPGCLMRALESESATPATVQRLAQHCGSSKPLEHVARIHGYLATAASNFTSAHLLAFTELVCPGGICSAISPQGTVTFRDSQHLTDTFVRELVPLASKVLTKN
ncbi:acyltransferase family protein [Seongchinamella sediminis]|uniref:acyltransferase family protein n=1 Tax=Seongchinamella sediminis TaxID=2283635 RepID=UPI0013C2CFDC|nr:acyltransferase family protein [Seongchinamella sediminis]